MLPPCTFALPPPSQPLQPSEEGVPSSHEGSNGAASGPRWPQQQGVPTLLDTCMQLLIGLLGAEPGAQGGAGTEPGGRGDGAECSGSGRGAGGDGGAQGGGVPSACHIAQVAEMLLPTTRTLYRWGACMQGATAVVGAVCTRGVRERA